MAIFDAVTEGEAHLLSYFRNADRLERARVMLATCQDESVRTTQETQKLEFFAAHIECNDYGRAQCPATAEVFAVAATTDEAYARLAALDNARARSNVVDIADVRTS